MQTNQVRSNSSKSKAVKQSETLRAAASVNGPPVEEQCKAELEKRSQAEFEGERAARWNRAWGKMSDVVSAPSGGWSELAFCRFVCAVVAEFGRELTELTEFTEGDTAPNEFARGQLAEAIQCAREVALYEDWPESIAAGDCVKLRQDRNGRTVVYVLGTLTAVMALALHSYLEEITDNIIMGGKPSRVLPLAEVLCLAEIWCDAEGCGTALEDNQNKPTPAQRLVHCVRVMQAQDEMAAPALKGGAK